MLHRFASLSGIFFAALAATLVFSAFTASAAVAETRSVSPFGMCSHMLWGYSNAEIDSELDLISAAGAAWVRIDVSWRDIETADNTYNTALLASLDHLVTAAKTRGISVLPVVMEFPDWANGGKGIWAPPTDDATFADFARFMAARYAGRITYWELGNEVNEREFWDVTRSLSPARYTAFLQKGYAGVKLGNPDALVISAGLAGSDDGYLQEMYDAGAKGSFDILGVHPYTAGRSPYATDANTPSSTFDGIAIMKTTMERNGDTTKKIWLTEAGWQTSSADYRVTQAEQAQFTYEAFQRVYESFPYVETLFTYGIRNNGTNMSVATDNYGLLANNYSPKPAYAAYRRAFTTFGQAAPGPAPIVTGTARVTIRSSRRTLRARGFAIVSGAVPSLALASVVGSSATVSPRASAVLQRKVGTTWVNVRTILTDETGHYTARIGFPKPAVYQYRIWVPASGTVPAATSNVVTIRVR